MVKGTFAAGCQDSFKIVVKPILSISANVTSTCRGNSLGTATVTAGTGNFSYVWNGPSGSLGTFTTTTQNNLAAGNYTVQVVDNTSKCPTKDTVITVGNVLPSLQTSSIQFCGTSPTLTAPAAASGTPYVWYNNANTMVPVTTQTNTISNAVNGQHYTVTYLDPTTNCEDSMRIALNEIKLNFTALPQNPCAGGNNGGITYNNGTTTNLYTNYNWSLTGTSISSGTVASTGAINLNGLSNGTYTMIITAPGNTTCSDTLKTVLSNTAAIVPATINLPPICNNDTLKINPSVPNVSHSWSGVGLVSGSNTSIPLTVLPTFTNTTSGYYNYTDSMHTIPGGCLSVVKYIVVMKSFKGSLVPLEKLICHNDVTGKLKASVSSEVNGPISNPDVYTFTWNPATLTTTTATGAPCNTVKTNLSAGIYACTISNGNCINTYTYNLVNPPALVNDSLYAYYCPKDSLALLVANSGHNPYNWHWLQHTSSGIKDSLLVNNGDSLIGVALTQNVNNYYVTYKTNGCPDSAKTVISVTTYDAFRPNELVNVFTPNGDKSNDYFYPFYQAGFNQYQIARKADSYDLKIYNRWGILVFESTDYNKPWDGKTKSGHDADNGSYFFIVKYKSNCASVADVVEKKGFLELMR